MPAKYLITGLATGFALLATTQFSGAVDAEDFTKKLIAAYEVQDSIVSYDSAIAKGDRVTLTRLTLVIPGESEVLNFGDMVFDGVVDDGAGGYQVASVREDKLELTADDVRVTLNDLNITNLRIPADPGAESLYSLLFYETASTGPIVLNIDGRDLIKIAESSVQTTRSPDGKRVNFSARTDGLVVDLSGMNYANTQRMIDNMGYQKLKGDATVSGFWQMSTGEINLSEYSLMLEDVGRIEMKFSVGGYTLDFVRGLQTMKKQLAVDKIDAGSQQAMASTLLGMLQQLTLKDMSLRFEDTSLTNKILDVVAGQRGISREMAIQGLKTILPFALLRLQNPDFQRRLSDALVDFLEDPKNIEISARPVSPLPFAVVAGSALSAPQTLPDVLSLTVKANE